MVRITRTIALAERDCCSILLTFQEVVIHAPFASQLQYRVRPRATRIKQKTLVRGERKQAISCLKVMALALQGNLSDFGEACAPGLSVLDAHLPPGQVTTESLGTAR